MSATRDWNSERAIVEAHAGERIAMIVESHARITGNDLVTPGGDLARSLWLLPAVVLAHATEEDPVFFYANRAALELFEMPAADFIRMPSRYSAEPVARAERERLLGEVARNNFISDYSGVRTARSGRKFRIERATVWNLFDPKGSMGGQAASFSDWTELAS